MFAVRGLYTDDDRRRRRAWLVAGLLAGLALTYRPDLAVAIGLLVGWLLWTAPADAPADPARRAVVGLLPMWYHLVVAGPRATFEGMFVDPVFRLRAGRELPRPPSWNRIDGALQAIAEEIPPWWRIPHLQVSHALFLWFFAMLLGTALLLAYAVIVRRRPGGVTARSTVLLAVALVSVGILPQALQRPDSTHLTWVTCVSWPFSIVVVAEIVRRHRPRVDWRAAVGTGAVVALLATHHVHAPCSRSATTCCTPAPASARCRAPFP